MVYRLDFLKGFDNTFDFNNDCYYQINLDGSKHPNFLKVKHLKNKHKGI